MGSITGQKIDYNGAGALRGQRHIPSKTEPKYPSSPVPGGGGGESSSDVFVNLSDQLEG